MNRSIRLRSLRLALAVGLAIGGTLSANAQTLDYVLSVGDFVAPSGGTVDVSVDLDSSLGLGLDGWSYGLCHDGAVLFLDGTGATDPSTNAVTALGDLAGAPVVPEFETNSVFDDGADGETDGFTSAAVVSFLLQVTLPPAAVTEINRASYQVPGSPGDTSELRFCRSLGPFPIQISVIENQVSLVPTTNDGTFQVELVNTPFIRGECNQGLDGEVALADGIFLLGILAGSETLLCMEACDIDANGMLSILDAVLLFSYLFVSGAEPEPPFPDCGPGSVPNDGCVFDPLLCP